MTSSEIQKTFEDLRALAQKHCQCDNRNFLAPAFHRPGCSYILEAEKILGYTDKPFVPQIPSISKG